MDLLGVAEVNMAADASTAATKAKKDKKDKKEKKEKKDKKEKKERKEKKSSKKLSADNAKSGYEEALGISTPSKEIVTS